MKNLAQLRLIHSDETLENGIARFSLMFWRTQSTKSIVESLRIGQIEPLKVKSDGRIFNGNVRCRILIERNFDINILKREVID
ncbi:hypothetical protein BH20ACI1_BH20ACI1_22710 [soil metagenome]